MRKKKDVKKRKQPPSYPALIRGGILISALIMTSSLSFYMGPSVLEKADRLYRRISGQTSEPVPDNLISDTAGPIREAGAGGPGPEPGQEPEQGQTGPDSPSVPYLEVSRELGRLDDLTLDKEPEQVGASYAVMLNTAMGPMLYYNQADQRWGDYLYGGQDPMKKYGCGPTAVAMIINSFSTTPATPVSAADWAADNGCYAPQGGSYHNLIQDSLSAHGIHVESVKQRTAGNAAGLLDSGHILIALMGKGALTDNGHFILITEYLDNGNVHIADPNSYENSTKEWELGQLMAELKQSHDNGAPLWAVGPEKVGTEAEGAEDNG